MLFQEAFEDINSPDVLKIYPDFKVRVIAVKDIPPVHPMFEPYHGTTQALIQRLFAGQSLGRTVVHPTFVFPERYMTRNQIREFMQTLATSPEAKAKKIHTVDIVTSEPVILTDFTADMIRIVHA